MKEVENPKYLGQLEPKWSTPQMPSPTQCHFQGLPYPLIEGSLLLLDAPFLILGSTGTSQQVAVQWPLYFGSASLPGLFPQIN